MEVSRILWFGRNLRARKRYQQVLAVLIKYGFDDVVARIGPLSIRRMFRRRRNKIRIEERGEKLTAKRIRLALEELGPTYIKFGQMLSTRPDLLAPDVIEELKKLQDDVPSFPFGTVKSWLEENQWGKPISALFQEFDETPLAAASISQIHRAITLDGTDVVVKIRRPGIPKIVETDLIVLETIANFLARTFPEAKIYDPPGLVEAFGKSIRRELNFTLEARNLDRFRAMFRDDDTYEVPEVHWGLTSGAVLVMGFVPGTKVSKRDELLSLGLDPEEIARRGAKAILKQVLKHGIFHADPHPGNILVLPENVICPVDYGMVGRLDENTRTQFIDILRAIGEQDVDRLCQLMAALGGIEPHRITRELQVDVDDLLDRFAHAPLGQIKVGELIQNFNALLYRHQLHVPPDFLLLFKALATIESVAVELAPGFDMLQHVEPFVREMIKERLSPSKIAGKLVKVTEDLTDLGLRLPREAGEILDLVRRNRLRVGLDHRGLKEIVADLDRTGNRIVFGVVIAALIVAAALVLHIDVGPTIWGYPALGVIVMAIALLMGLRLAFAVYRSGNL